MIDPTPRPADSVVANVPHQTGDTILVDEREAARLLCISERSLRRLRQENHIKGLRIGNLRRYSRAELEAYVARLASSGTE